VSRLDPVRVVLISIAGWMNQRQQHAIDYLREENRVLREQLGGRRLRFTDNQRRRLAAKAKGLGRRVLAEIATIVTPETLLALHRKLIARKYDGAVSRVSARRTQSETESLVVQMARENPDWGYTRIVGALSNLGHNLARGTVANILKRHGVEPAPAIMADSQAVISSTRSACSESFRTARPTLTIAVRSPPTILGRTIGSRKAHTQSTPKSGKITSSTRRASTTSSRTISASRSRCRKK
jgi:hypothetical protein